MITETATESENAQRDLMGGSLDWEEEKWIHFAAGWANEVQTVGVV